MAAEQHFPSAEKRMQGKTCFNFKDVPSPALMVEFEQLTAAGFKQWADKNWL